MTFGRTRSVTLEGLVGAMVEVEAHLSNGLPAFMLGGLPDAACAQAPGRVKAAAASIGRSLAQERITANLSPASIPKNGSGFDLPITVAVLAALGVLPASKVAGVVHLGELGLDGTVRAVRGVLPAVLAAARAGCPEVVVPLDNAAEAALVPDIRVHAVQHISDLVSGYAIPGPLTTGVTALPVPQSQVPDQSPDLVDVIGQEEARAAIELAAGGGHHLFMLGPPGSGKTMLAERLVSILPPLTREQSIDVLAVRSLLGVKAEELQLGGVPPFVAPHHSASQAAIIGGGSGMVRPGAISQAHASVNYCSQAASPQYFGVWRCRAGGGFERTPTLDPRGTCLRSRAGARGIARGPSCGILISLGRCGLVLLIGRGGTGMEVAPGVFVTAASKRDWQPHPHPAGEIHVLCRGVGLHAGLWRCVPGTTPQQLEWTASGREAKIVLAGTSRVEIKDGPTLELSAGDIASVPKGATATWSFSDDYQEFWVLDDLGTGD